MVTLLTGCFQTEKSALDDVTDSEYDYTICKASCDNESNNLSDAINQAKIAGISEERIEAAKALGRDKANRELVALRASLDKKCKLKNKIACYTGDGCCEDATTAADATAEAAAATEAAADATAAAADAATAAADAAAPAVDGFNADYSSEIAAIDNEIKYAMDSYRYFYDLSNQIIYPDDVYPPEIRNHFIMPRMILCLNETKLACKEKELKQVNSTTVKLIYQWVGGADGTYSSIPNHVKRKAQVDYDILVQRGTNLTTKEAVDNASNYAKNAAQNYYPKIALDAYEVTGSEEPAVNE